MNLHTILKGQFTQNWKFIYSLFIPKRFDFISFVQQKIRYIALQ